MCKVCGSDHLTEFCPRVIAQWPTREEEREEKRRTRQRVAQEWEYEAMRPGHVAHPRKRCASTVCCWQAYECHQPRSGKSKYCVEHARQKAREWYRMRGKPARKARYQETGR